MRPSRTRLTRSAAGGGVALRSDLLFPLLLASLASLIRLLRGGGERESDGDLFRRGGERDRDSAERERERKGERELEDRRLGTGDLDISRGALPLLDTGEGDRRTRLLGPGEGEREGVREREEEGDGERGRRRRTGGGEGE
jgi:hypothetical protein